MNWYIPHCAQNLKLFGKKNRGQFLVAKLFTIIDTLFIKRAKRKKN